MLGLNYLLMKNKKRICPRTEGKKDEGREKVERSRKGGLVEGVAEG